MSTKALRLYERLGLVEPVRTDTGWRTYGPDQMVRLHQVLALKSLGVPLKRAGELLGGQLADLDAVLRLQESALRSRMADDARKAELLAAVRSRLAHGETLSVDDLIHLTRETVMTDPIDGRLCAVHLRVADTERATAYFGRLFGWTFAAADGGGSRWADTTAGVGDRAWAMALTDDPSAPRVRLGFEVAEPAEALARARSLGGAGKSPEVSADDQGLPLAFHAPQRRPPPSRKASGELGVAVALVGDTARAKAFYGGLFGDDFGQIGPQDRWWSTRAAFGVFSSALGVFSNDHTPGLEAGDAPEVHVFVCVRDLAAHQDRVRALGGSVVAEAAMGPYEVSACRDDQGTRFQLWRDPSR